MNAVCLERYWKRKEVMKVKGKIIGLLIFLGNGAIMDSVDAGTLGFKWAIYLLLIDLVAFGIFCANQKKKSATSRPRNGQARKEHKHKCIHIDCTPIKGGVSSVL